MQAIRSLMACKKQMSADAAACFLTSLIMSKTHESRADALYCLLTQAIRSLMARKKQMSADAAACFLTSLIISCKSVYVQTGEVLHKGHG